MLDALYASIVVVILNELGVRDVISIHDAFLVPESVHRELRESVYRDLRGLGGSSGSQTVRPGGIRGPAS